MGSPHEGVRQFDVDGRRVQRHQHVTTCDLPETAKTWLTLGRETGFANVTQLFLDPTGFYGLYRYDV